MSPASKPAPPKPSGPGPKPSGPTRPVPSSPPRRYADDLLFAAVDATLGDLMTPARRDPSSAAVGADAIATPGGPVTFRLPPPAEPPSFDDGPAVCAYGCTRQAACDSASSHWWSAYPFGAPIRT